MNTKLATGRMRTGQWADIIKDYISNDIFVAHKKVMIV